MKCWQSRISKNRRSFTRVTFGVDGHDYGPLELVALPLKEPKGVDVFVGYNHFAGHAVCIDYRNGWLGIEGS